jgi:copper(I)-binding protein
MSGETDPVRLRGTIMKRTLLAAFACALMLAGAADAAEPTHSYKLDGITVSDAWARASLGKAPNSAAYLTLRNDGPADDRLIAVETEAAAKPELHTTKMADGVMKMRPLEGVDLPAGGEATLAVGGSHVMLMGLRAPLHAGDSFPMTLVFEKAGRLSLEVEVRALGAAGGNHAGMGHGTMDHGTMNHDEMGHPHGETAPEEAMPHKSGTD